MATPLWQRKGGKNPSGGLNEKGRKSYERQNPGSDLKAPVKKGDNPRRASFLARMGERKRTRVQGRKTNKTSSKSKSMGSK